MNDARVVCRELGYKYSIRALKGPSVSPGYGKIWLNNVNCTGNEQNLTSCEYNGWGINNCGYLKDAGVECSSTGNDFIFPFVRT